MKEAKLAECACKSFNEFREEFPALCVNPGVTPEAVEKTAKDIYKALNKLPLTAQETHAFISMIHHELGNFYLGKHADGA